MKPKIPKLTKGDIVCIDWHDTNIPYEKGWQTEEEHGKWVDMGGDKVRSVGIYVSQDEDYLHLVGDTDMFFSTKVSYLRPINITKGFISSLKILKKARNAV